MSDPQQESRSLINIAVVRNSHGEVLVIRRAKKETGADGSVLEWAFPGGKQKIDESRKENVEREVLAETGYKIISEREISMRVPHQFPIILVYHFCRLAETLPVSHPHEDWEVAEIKWVEPQELRALFTTDLDPGVAKELGI